MIIGAIGIIPKNLGKDYGEENIKGRIETVQTIAGIGKNTLKTFEELRSVVTRSQLKSSC